MILHACRIIKAKHINNAFSGEGARLAGGRWNHPGTPVVYTSQTASLAMLEILVHIQNEQVLPSYVMFDFAFDDALVQTATLPANWRDEPAPKQTKDLGSRWTRANTSCILKVPSVIVPSEWNYLLNPAHADFRHIKIASPTQLDFDPRLIPKR